LTEENSTEKPEQDDTEQVSDDKLEKETSEDTKVDSEKTQVTPEEDSETTTTETTTPETTPIENQEESTTDSSDQAIEDMPTITDEELDSQFKYEILNEPGGEDFLRCMQCGTCTASCPVKVIDPDYNCRRIIRMALIGDKEKVLKSKFIWMCSTCYSCYERCPQDVKITDLMTALKNIAVKYGYIHPNIKELITYLEKFGGLTEVSDFENRMREKFGLPKINQSPERVQKVLEKVNIKKIIEGES
jgi:heterodisulfide reductase subunit C